MPVTVALTRSRDAAGNVTARLGLPLPNEYLEFLAGRCQPSTVLAVALSGSAASRIWNRRLGRVYFLAFLNPCRGQPDPALTARLAGPTSVGKPEIEFD